VKNHVTTLGIALTLALAHAAQAQGITPPPVPTNIEVPAPHEVFLRGRITHPSERVRELFDTREVDASQRNSASATASRAHGRK
jgi:hypothetical protein